MTARTGPDARGADPPAALRRSEPVHPWATRRAGVGGSPVTRLTETGSGRYLLVSRATRSRDQSAATAPNSAGRTSVDGRTTDGGRAGLLRTAAPGAS